MHAELTRYELTVWTAGNVSARVPDADLLVVKPSGVSYQDLTPENKDELIVLDETCPVPVDVVRFERHLRHRLRRQRRRG